MYQDKYYADHNTDAKSIDIRVCRNYGIYLDPNVIIEILQENTCPHFNRLHATKSAAILKFSVSYLGEIKKTGRVRSKKALSSLGAKSLMFNGCIRYLVRGMLAFNGAWGENRTRTGTSPNGF